MKPLYDVNLGLEVGLVGSTNASSHFKMNVLLSKDLLPVSLLEITRGVFVGFLSNKTVKVECWAEPYRSSTTLQIFRRQQRSSLPAPANRLRVSRSNHSEVSHQVIKRRCIGATTVIRATPESTVCHRPVMTLLGCTTALVQAAATRSRDDV